MVGEWKAWSVGVSCGTLVSVSCLREVVSICLFLVQRQIVFLRSTGRLLHASGVRLVPIQYGVGNPIIWYIIRVGIQKHNMLSVYGVDVGLFWYLRWCRGQSTVERKNP